MASSAMADTVGVPPSMPYKQITKKLDTYLAWRIMLSAQDSPTGEPESLPQPKGGDAMAVRSVRGLKNVAQVTARGRSRARAGCIDVGGVLTAFLYYF